MTILSYQSIRERCLHPERFSSSAWSNHQAMPMLVPFEPEKVIANGKSYGCSSSSYDVRIGHDLVLGPNLGFVALELLHAMATNPWGIEGSRAKEMAKNAMKTTVPHFALAHTLEDFFMPYDVCATVVDKSSYARVFVSAFNTLIDPGFQGNLTLELVNLSDKEVVYKEGDPVCQIMFHKLDEPTERPYKGKYQHQTKAAHPARYEGE